MKLSAVGNTGAVMFEPENKREAKVLNKYMANKEFMATKQAKTNMGVGLGAIVLSYPTMMLSMLAKSKKTKIASAVVALASLGTAIGFAIKQAVDKKKFNEPKLEPVVNEQTAQGPEDYASETIMSGSTTLA